MWSTRIRGVAEAAGVGFRPVRNLEMLTARLADSPVAALILDLEAGEVCFDLLRILRTSTPAEQVQRIRVLAFAPHVAVDVMQRAIKEGADVVLARGAFARMMPDLLVKLSRGDISGLRSQLTD